jgi:hypothetical protein
MDKRLQAMLDHYEITNVLKEYSRGCDRGDEPRMASVYAKDGMDDHGSYHGSGVDFAKRTVGRMKPGDALTHLLGQTIVKVNGDKAGAETYFIATSKKEGSDTLNQLGGRFVDSLVRENGQWKIKHRIVMHDWSVAHAHTVPWLTDFPQAQNSNDDPSFAVLGETHSGALAAPPAAPKPAPIKSGWISSHSSTA